MLCSNTNKIVLLIFKNVEMYTLT